MNNHLNEYTQNILVWMVGKPCIIITTSMCTTNFHISDQVNSHNCISEMAEAYTQNQTHALSYCVLCATEPPRRVYLLSSWGLASQPWGLVQR